MSLIIPRTFLAAIPAAWLLASCAHSGNVGSVGGGGSPPPPPPVFTLEDLEGDWVGQLTPENSARPVQNFYLRFVNEDLASAADSAGNEWRADNSDRVFHFKKTGLLEANLGLLVGVTGLEIQAKMNNARAVLSGTYIQIGPDLFPVEGSLELVRSSGASMFGTALLAGDWTGTVANPLGRSQIMNLSFDAAGAVVGGAMIRTGQGTTRRSYSVGAGTFSFFDGAIGRIQDVTLTADDGTVSFLHYLLVDRDGTLLAGPGTDQIFGAGFLRLSR